MSSYLLSYKYEPQTIDNICGNHIIFNKIENSLNIKKSSNFIIQGNNGIGKTIFANLLKNKLQKINSNLVEYLNMADVIGLTILISKIQNFLNKKITNSSIKQLVILDDIDKITTKSQYSIRILMEEFQNKCNFILICNSTNNIIDIIQHRCELVVLKSLESSDIVPVLDNICKSEKINYSKEILETLAYIGGGDIRVSINCLQQLSAIYKDNCTVEMVYNICDYPQPELITNIFNKMKLKDYKLILDNINTIYLNGYSFYDIINIIFKVIKTYEIQEIKRFKIIEVIGDSHLLNANGNTSLLQFHKLFSCIFKIVNSEIE